MVLDSAYTIQPLALVSKTPLYNNERSYPEVPALTLNGALSPANEFIIGSYSFTFQLRNQDLSVDMLLGKFYDSLKIADVNVTKLISDNLFDLL